MASNARARARILGVRIRKLGFAMDNINARKRDTMAEIFPANLTNKSRSPRVRELTRPQLGM